MDNTSFSSTNEIRRGLPGRGLEGRHIKEQAAGWGELEITRNTGLSGRGFQWLENLQFGW